MKKIVTSSLAILLLTFFQSLNAYETSYAVTSTQNTPGYLNQVASTLADQLAQNKDFKDIYNTPIAVMSIVNLEDFSQTTKTSNIVTENLIHEMQIRGFKVIDYKVMPSIKIGKENDYIFSRDLKDLRSKQNINYALSGTYTLYKNGMSINLRIVNIQNNIVLSTAQAFIPKRIVRDAQRDSMPKNWSKPESQVQEHSIDIQTR